MFGRIRTIGCSAGKAVQYMTASRLRNTVRVSWPRDIQDGEKLRCVLQAIDI